MALGYLKVGSGIFLILVVVGKLTHADYIKESLLLLFVVSVVAFAPIHLVIYGLARSAWKTLGSPTRPSTVDFRTSAVLQSRPSYKQDDSTHRVYRLYDFTKSLQITPDQYYCVSGKVNSADKLYLVLESVKMDTEHCRCSTTPASAGGAAGGSLMK